MSRVNRRAVASGINICELSVALVSAINRNPTIDDRAFLEYDGLL